MVTTRITTDMNASRNDEMLRHIFTITEMSMFILSFLPYSAVVTACEYSIGEMEWDGNRRLQDVPKKGWI